MKPLIQHIHVQYTGPQRPQRKRGKAPWLLRLACWWHGLDIEVK